MSLIKRLGIRLRTPVKIAKHGIDHLLAVPILVLLPSRSWAADWSAPATTMLDSLESGLVSIAAPIIGIGVIAYGIWAMVSGRIDIMRLAQLVVAGALVIFGPTLLRTLLSAA